MILHEEFENVHENLFKAVAEHEVIAGEAWTRPAILKAALWAIGKCADACQSPTAKGRILEFARELNGEKP